MSNGLNLNLGNLSLLSNALTRSISPENFTGEPGKAGMATEGTGARPARELGQGWKVSPSINIPAHTTVTLADIDGSGAIQHIWLTVAPEWWRKLVLRCYWDGEAAPSIEVPLGDFFCNGWSERCNVSSLAVAVNPAGGFNCYWEMPFRRHARITIENLTDADTSGFYYQVTYALTDVPDDAAYFHAQWRRSNPLPYMQDHVLLDGVRGQGHYVGTYIAWGVNNNGWWGEGEIKFFMDADQQFPTICGTGTEDYFGGAWDFLNPEGRVRCVFVTLFGTAAGDHAGRTFPQPAAFRHVSLAHHGPDPLPRRAPRDHSGARLALGSALSTAARRHRLDRLLVSDRAARALPGAARPQRSRSHLKSADETNRFLWGHGTLCPRRNHSLPNLNNR